MRVIHIVHGRANPNGHNGISRVVYHLNRAEKALGIASEIWAVTDDAREPYSFRRDDDVSVECFPRVRLPFGGNPIIDRLKDEAGEIDLIHFHMIWFLDKNIIANAARKAGLRIVATPHGTYAKPYARSGKRRFARPVERLFLNSSDAVHAITPEEERRLRNYGYRGPTFQAPNGLSLEEIPPLPVPQNRPGGPVRFLWIGVKRPEKNLDALIKAVSLLPRGRQRDIRVSIMGPDFKRTEARLHMLAGKLGVQGSFDFCGAVYGADKRHALSKADAFILPSQNEVFALAMLDAMAFAKPCLVSHGCGYEQFSDKDFFVGFRPEPRDIARALDEFLERREEWPQMGLRARGVIETHLNWPVIARQIVRHYREVVA